MTQESKLSISSIILGQLVDKALFIPSVFLLVASLDPLSTTFSILALVLGSLCTFAGSYFAAHRAKHSFVLHAMLVASITFALSFTRFLFSRFSDEPSIHALWWEFLSWSMVFVVGFLGGSLAKKTADSADA